MFAEMLSKLDGMAGAYIGEGINHEGQPFTGCLELKQIFEGRGFHLRFTATGNDGTLYHREESTIAPSIDGKLVLWNFNTNTPGLIPHELRVPEPKPEALASFVFNFNKPEDKNAFREEVALDIWDKSTLSYTYSWGSPARGAHVEGGCACWAPEVYYPFL